jgi:hypothetical protein
MPQANSTFSRPRATSPSASAMVLPFSADDLGQPAAILHNQIAQAKHDLRAARKRRRAPFAPQRFGRATARSTSSTPAKPTSAIDLAGCRIGDRALAPGVAASALPLIQ